MIRDQVRILYLLFLWSEHKVVWPESHSVTSNKVLSIPASTLVIKYQNFWVIESSSNVIVLSFNCLFETIWWSSNSCWVIPNKLAILFYIFLRRFNLPARCTRSCCSSTRTTGWSIIDGDARIGSTVFRARIWSWCFRIVVPFSNSTLTDTGPATSTMVPGIHLPFPL